MEYMRSWSGLAEAMSALTMDLARLLRTNLRSRTALSAENLFLRKELALYRERQLKLRKTSGVIRLALVLLARCFTWREVFTIVQRVTLLR